MVDMRLQHHDKVSISIIIPTKDRQLILSDTVRQALEAIQGRPAEIIVVNDSRSNTLDLPSDQRIRIIPNDGAGAAAARNTGAKLANGKLLLFLDDDIIISRETLIHVLAVHEVTPNICLNLDWEYPPQMKQSLIASQFGRFLRRNNFTTFKGWYNDLSWRDNQLFRAKAIASFHLSMSKSDFEMVGGYNDSFPAAGFEDYDFPMRLRKAGLSMFIDTRVKVYHNEEDKFSLEKWLLNQERRAGTRKVAVELGYTELALRFSLPKRVILWLLVLSEKFLGLAARVVPNRITTDFIYEFMVKGMVAGRIYKGYHEGLIK